MAFCAAFSRAAVGQVLASRALAVAGASVTVTKHCLSKEQVLGRAVQHATFALNHSVNRMVDSGNMTLAQAVEMEMERKEFLNGLQEAPRCHCTSLPLQAPAMHHSMAGDSMEDSFQRPALPMPSCDHQIAMHCTGCLPVSGTRQQHGLLPASERSSRSISSSSHSADRLLKFLNPKLLELEEDMSSVNNLTLMEALRQQKAKMEMDACDLAAQ